jgi:flagellar hook-basal body complex protein FliE
MPFEVTRTTGPSAGSPLRAAKTAAGSGAEGATAFAESLAGLVENVEKSSAEANTAIQGMVDKNTDVHEAMIALQRAEMALQLTVQVRNKVVQAYQDIMRMPI